MNLWIWARVSPPAGRTFSGVQEGLESLGTLPIPTGTSSVHGIEDVKRLGVFFEGIEFLLQQNILLGHIGNGRLELCLVLRLGECVTYDLVH